MHGDRVDMQRVDKWAGPLVGILFCAVFAAAVILLGEGQDATKKTAQEVVDYYTQHTDQHAVGAIMAGLGAALFLFFAGWWRSVLRRAEGEGGFLAAVSFGGAIVFASAAAIGATLHFTLVDTADNIDPIAVQALNAIDYEFYIPFVVGVGVFILASGISVVRHGALPKWLGWIAILIGIVAFTPIGFFALLAAILWVLVVCIIGLVRARGDGAPAPGVPGV
jgi:hypothetical protein